MRNINVFLQLVLPGQSNPQSPTKVLISTKYLHPNEIISPYYQNFSFQSSGVGVKVANGLAFIN